MEIIIKLSRSVCVCVGYTAFTTDILISKSATDNIARRKYERSTSPHQGILIKSNSTNGSSNKLFLLRFTDAENEN